MRRQGSEADVGQQEPDTLQSSLGKNCKYLGFTSATTMTHCGTDVTGKRRSDYLRATTASTLTVTSEARYPGQRGPVKKVARRLVRNPYWDILAGLVILADFAGICRDTDTHAATGSANDLSKLISTVCFLFYCADLAVRVIAYGLKFFNIWTNILDVVLVCMTVVEYGLEVVTDMHQVSSLVLLRMARLCRLLRLMRAVKLFARMKDLRRLLQMVSTCARTLFWSFLLSFVLMSTWAVLAVEFVHPVASRLAEEGQWPGCERCGRAFESVMAANLTFFQTVLAGDSWGLLAVPICEASPATSLIFCGVLLTLIYGMMQLITAVVVDSFAERRKHDVNALVSEIHADEKKEKGILIKIFEQIDVDRSGYISFDELSDGARRIDEFRNWLRVMDIDSTDLERLFGIIDDDGSGEVDLKEFMDALYRMKNAESRTATKFVKHTVEKLEKKSDEFMVRVAIDLAGINKELRRLQRQLQERSITTKRCEVLGLDNGPSQSEVLPEQRASPLADVHSGMSSKGNEKKALMLATGGLRGEEPSSSSSGPTKCAALAAGASTSLEEAGSMLGKTKTPSSTASTSSPDVDAASPPWQEALDRESPELLLVQQNPLFNILAGPPINLGRELNDEILFVEAQRPDEMLEANRSPGQVSLRSVKPRLYQTRCNLYAEDGIKPDTHVP
eukprot:TRINITY_DN39980_c0_g1_i1.p1 TRINITY_DN39980_c0_g1~~TRINITY_DN39980_c0_g1_i1.p1  ORF type:complete len:676 (+),score=95.61 TRINITY_DN39980_c0_g1_i1:115-2142(+)